MYVTRLVLNFGSIVLFDPDRLRAFYGGHIAAGTDLYTRYITTDEGDAVVAAGLIVPIGPIEPNDFIVHIRLATEPSAVQGEIIAENGIYPLQVEKRLGIWDHGALTYWREDDWEPVEAPPGIYAVAVRGWRRMRKDGTDVEEAGYEFILEPRAELPASTFDWHKDMRLLSGPNAPPGLAGD